MSYDKSKPSEFDGIFQQAAQQNGLSYDMLRKLAFNESSFNPKAKSPTGPIGIMQFTKGTAKALGLNVTGGADDDRYNAEKSIYAAARHIAELKTKFGGDELKAALAYNQGEGPKGLPQLAAYDRGDFSKISHEGLNYMRKLMDVTDGKQKDALMQFGGITPKAKGAPVEDVTKGIGDIKGKVGTELPESVGFNIEGKKQEEPAKPFAQTFWEAHGTTVEEYDNRSTFFGFGKAASAELANSPIGAVFRASQYDDGFDVIKDVFTPTAFNSYQPTEEDLEKLRNSGLHPDYYHVVTGGDADTWDDLIKYALENQKKDMEAADTGLGAKLAAGLVGAAADPLSYVPYVGQAAKGGKLAAKVTSVGLQTAATSAASEALRSSIVGGEADYTSAVVGGALLGGGMTAALDRNVAREISQGVTHFKNEWLGPTARLDAREKAFQTSEADLSKVNVEHVAIDKELDGVPFGDHPSEPGAVVMQDGSVISGFNPLNPKTIKEFAEIDPDKAARGFAPIRGFTELGYALLRSDNPKVRGLAKDLVRSSTGTTKGTSGKFGATASDIVERLSGKDNQMVSDLMKAVKEATSDPAYTVGPNAMTTEAARQAVFKKAALAVERPELQTSLTKGERKVMDLLKTHFDNKRELMENPKVFGNNKAESIFPESRHKGTYIPNVYDRAAKTSMVAKLGHEGLQEAIAQSWLTSYHARPEVKTRVDESLAESLGVEEVTLDMVEKYARDKAYGISHSDNFLNSGIDAEEHWTAGLSENKFLEARHLFDSDMQATLPDGSLFAVNDLRDYDMFSILPAYNRRINGDIAIMGGTGKTTAVLRDEIEALRPSTDAKGTAKADYESLVDAVKIVTGRSRIDPEGVGSLALRGLSDLAFTTKNFFMPLMNFTEIAGLGLRGVTSLVTNNIPFVRDLATRKDPLSVKEIKDLHGFVFGKELDDTIRPRLEDIKERLRKNSTAPEWAQSVTARFKYGTQEVAAWSPFTRALNGTTNLLIDHARQGVLSDIAAFALKGKSTKLAKDNYLNSASVTKEQWKGITDLFREYAERSEDGKFTIKDKAGFANDPRSMDLWRIADKFSQEAILQTHKVSMQSAKGHGAGMALALQFKNFVIRSVNGRTIRSYHEATKNNRKIDQSLKAIASIGLAAAGFTVQAQLNAIGMQDDARRKYLEKSMDPYMIAYAGFTRSSILGGPAGVFNILAGSIAGYDPAQTVRTSVLPHEEQERGPKGPMTSFANRKEIGGRLLAQVPGAGYAVSLMTLGDAIVDYAGSDRYSAETAALTQIMASVKELLPNDPVTQRIIVEAFENAGAQTRK